MPSLASSRRANEREVIQVLPGIVALPFHCFWPLPVVSYVAYVLHVVRSAQGYFDGGVVTGNPKELSVRRLEGFEPVAELGRAADIPGVCLRLVQVDGPAQGLNKELGQLNHAQASDAHDLGMNRAQAVIGTLLDHTTPLVHAKLFYQEAWQLN